MDKDAEKGQDDSKPLEDNPQYQRKRPEGRRYIETTENQKTSTFERIVRYLSIFIVAIFFPMSIFLCLFTVDEFQRAIIFRLGRLRKGALGPGLVWHLPCIDTVRIVDLRTRVVVIPTQDVITKDSVTISVDAVLFYCIQGSLHATIQISNVKESTIFIAQTTVRNMIGSMPLHELLTSRQSLSDRITVAVAHATEKWGVLVERVELKDISLPESLERSLASEAEALREARAKIISAEGELSASKALKEASDVMAENKITLQLRHLQTLTSISQERRLTICYPFPMEMVSAFTNNGKGDSKKDDNDDNDPSLSDDSSENNIVRKSSLKEIISHLVSEYFSTITMSREETDSEQPQTSKQQPEEEDLSIIDTPVLRSGGQSPANPKKQPNEDPPGISTPMLGSGAQSPTKPTPIDGEGKPDTGKGTQTSNP